MEDKIRQLCEHAVAEKDPAKFRQTLTELREALHQHIGRIRDKLADYPVAPERRRRTS